MGVPVVATDRTALPDGAANGGIAIVLPRRDAPVLAERLAELAGNPARRRELGQAARRSALGRLGLDEFLAERESLYRGMLGD
jgi:glycosyltransferase involved in cell wall biosynthesis